MTAAARGHSATVTRLIEAKAKVDIKGEGGGTAMMKAAYQVCWCLSLSHTHSRSLSFNEPRSWRSSNARLTQQRKHKSLK